ncbi:MAG: hypothetical protein ACD_55C00169G0011 [uncultured bacterium]|uniref:Uncharacterized protein n=1 Tax=Citrifermentans bemidjiense (strain ATCC BAA-1014 / DSM 16622 / JCM 12645 / Bem) TaxID=404380 RepID=B5E9S5_CITBB|nr:hypothetical protein [Citrifermentans bemidjiense]ACH40249.1 hypothetical protein Gbem_3252 [Citrifermentans bemidjiense Bem]EKD59089.1 MAG: hypothetical protein ACD_55C00169G0011 [uncultured bacterium]
MEEKGLCSLIIKTFEGECPLDPESEAGTTRLAGINASIRRQIAAGYFDDVVSLLQSERIGYFDTATWNCLAEHLAGRLHKKRGAKNKLTYYRDELITLKVMELVLEGKTVTEAIAIVENIIGCDMGFKAIEAIYYSNRNVFAGAQTGEGSLTLEQVRQWGIEAQLQENEQRKRRGDKMMFFFSSDLK